MSVSERVERKDGSFVNVVADNKDELAEAVKAAKASNPVNSIDINRPVKEGHDLVVVNEDGSQELSDQVPETALNFNPEVEQKFNKMQDGGGANFNNAGAKAAANAAADVVDGKADSMGEAKVDTSTAKSTK